MDNIKNLNWPESFLGGASSRNLILHLVLTLLIYVVSCIQDVEFPRFPFLTPSKLFFVSWFGIFTLLLSYVAVMMFSFSLAVMLSYGIISFSPKLSASLFWCSSFQSFAKSLGIAPYSLGYNFAFLTFYVLPAVLAHPQKQVRHDEQPKTFRVTTRCVAVVCFAYLFLGSLCAAYFSADPRGVQQMVVQNLPAASWASATIFVLVAASCLCTMPVFVATAAELLESGCGAGGKG